MVDQREHHRKSILGRAHGKEQGLAKHIQSFGTTWVRCSRYICNLRIRAVRQGGSGEADAMKVTLSYIS